MWYLIILISISLIEFINLFGSLQLAFLSKKKKKKTALLPDDKINFNVENSCSKVWRWHAVGEQAFSSLQRLSGG